MQIDRICTAKYHPVVMALMAIAIDQYHITGLYQRLHHDLVGTAGAIGREERMLGSERIPRKFLGLLQRTGRL